MHLVTIEILGVLVNYSGLVVNILVEALFVGKEQEKHFSRLERIYLDVIVLEDEVATVVVVNEKIKLLDVGSDEVSFVKALVVAV